MKPSQRCYDLISKWESFSAKPYVCPAGKWTIGYGHTKGVTETSPPITIEQAVDLLAEDAEEAAEAINRLCKATLTQGQFDAMCSLTFNIGIAAFTKSTLLKMVNAGNWAGAARQFDLWIHSNGRVLNGLVERRKEERALFESTGSKKKTGSSWWLRMFGKKGQ
jgi:lysozyme